MSQPITPTVGRVLWYWPSSSDTMSHTKGQPLAAIIASVHGDRMVNLSVIDSVGISHGRTSVLLLQPGDERPTGVESCAWMPFQVGQAAKYEEAKAQIGRVPAPASA